MKGRGDIPIIICCSEDDEPALAKVLDELRREGMSPELVPGVEFDAALLASALDVAAAETLFVLCTSSSLDKAAVRKLTGLFSARRGPAQRIISTAFTPSRPLAVLPAIRGALKEMRLTDHDANDPDAPNTHLRDVVEALTPAALAPADPEQLARELSRGLTEAAALLDRSRPAPRRGTPTGLGAASPTSGVGAPQVIAEDPVVLPSREPPRSVAGSMPVRAEEDTAELPPQPPRRSLESTLSQVPSAGADELVTDFTPSRQIPRAAARSMHAATYDEPRGNRWLLLFAGLGIAGIVALAVLQLFQPSADPGPRSAGARPDGAAGDPSAAVVAPPVTGGAPVEARVDDGGAPTPTPTADAKLEPDAKAVVPDAKLEPKPTPATDDDGGTDDGAAAPPVDIPPGPEAVSRRDLEQAALQLAVSEGRVERLGNLWVARGGEDEVTWDEAHRRCQNKRVNGVTGFRLPGVHELRKIRAARLLARASYWARNRAAVPDEAVAYDGGAGTTTLYLKLEPNARGLCVRTL